MHDYKQKARDILSARRTHAELEARRIYDELLNDDEYFSLNSERVDLSMQIARLARQNADLSILKARLADVKAQMEVRANALGHTLAELSPRYTCARCNDTGFVDGEECSCFKALVYESLREGCPELLTDISSFNDISLDLIPENDRPAHAKLYAILDKFQSEFPNNRTKILGINGPVGTGKSYALCVLANAVMKRGFSVLYLNSAEMNSLFLKYHLASLDAKKSIWEPLIDVDLLILDDLGAEPLLKNVTVNYLYCLLTERHGRAIAFTTNLSETQLLEKYGERVFSRLSDKSVRFMLTLTGKDLRLSPRK